MEATSLRRAGELMLPGTAIGLLAGGLAGLLAAVAGLGADYIAGTALGLGIPLALGGAGYNWMIATGRGRLGSMSFAAVYWLPLFPLARVVHELALDVATGHALVLSDDVLPFLVYQALLSVGYAVGFVLLHERAAPFWWLHVRDHNPVAARYVAEYVRFSVVLTERKAQLRDAKVRGKARDAGARG